MVPTDRNKCFGPWQKQPQKSFRQTDGRVPSPGGCVIPGWSNPSRIEHRLELLCANRPLHQLRRYSLALCCSLVSLRNGGRTHQRWSTSSGEKRPRTGPLHLAAVGGPNSPRWNPPAQSATIACLINAGADPNAKNKDGTTPLHRAVRTRCAEAVRTLLEHGADPAIRTKNGSTARHLALYTTGRGGSGSPEAGLAPLKRRLSKRRSCFCWRGVESGIANRGDSKGIQQETLTAPCI